MSSGNVKQAVAPEPTSAALEGVLGLGLALMRPRRLGLDWRLACMLLSGLRRPRALPGSALAGLPPSLIWSLALSERDAWGRPGMGAPPAASPPTSRESLPAQRERAATEQPLVPPMMRLRPTEGAQPLASLDWARGLRGRAVEASPSAPMAAKPLSAQAPAGTPSPPAPSLTAHLPAAEALPAQREPPPAQRERRDTEQPRVLPLMRPRPTVEASPSTAIAAKPLPAQALAGAPPPSRLPAAEALPTPPAQPGLPSRVSQVMAALAGSAQPPRPTTTRSAVPAQTPAAPHASAAPPPLVHPLPPAARAEERPLSAPRPPSPSQRVPSELQGLVQNLASRRSPSAPSPDSPSSPSGAPALVPRVAPPARAPVATSEPLPMAEPTWSTLPRRRPPQAAVPPGPPDLAPPALEPLPSPSSPPRLVNRLVQALPPALATPQPSRLGDLVQGTVERVVSKALERAPQRAQRPQPPPAPPAVDFNNETFMRALLSRLRALDREERFRSGLIR